MMFPALLDALPITPMHFLIPKWVLCLREGYTASKFVNDLVAGITVAVIALPLAMAFGISSIPENVAADLAAVHPWLTPPAMGLFTAVAAGFLMSFFGGSRVLIGGPTGAFIVIIYGVASRHGYDGLATATLMAAIILILLGLFRFGSMIKFIPYPVTTGFTTGIAVIIASQQIKEFIGVSPHDAMGQSLSLPPEFVAKLQMIAASIDTIDWPTVGVSVGSMAVLIIMRRYFSRIPGAIVAVILASIVVHLTGMDKALGGTVETIGSRFTQGIPKTLPMPHLPHIQWSLVRDLIPDATTIAVLAAIESLLAAVVADGMIGTRHKSDCELVAQGIANLGSVFFFGIPATGAIARTAANVKSGGRTPFAGMIHAATLLAFMLFLAPLAKLIPLPTLAAVLIMVAWNMSELDHFRFILRAPRSDILVLLTTFGLTVFADLTIAVGVGMVLASMLFMKRMSTVSNVSEITEEMMANNADERELADDPMALSKKSIPHDVEVFEIDGPFFFGVADRLMDTLSGMEPTPRAFILRMRRVPAMDATGLHALEEFYHKCHRQRTTLILSGIHTQPLSVLTRAGLDRVIGLDNIVGDLDAALTRASEFSRAAST